MNTKVKNILKYWKKSIEKYNKIDDWNFHEYVSVLSGYIRNNEDDTHKDVRRLIRSLRDNVLCPNPNLEQIIQTIEKALSAMSPPAVCMFSKKVNGRMKIAGQEVRFKDETEQLFKERLRFKEGMLLRNFDIETENAKDSRKVRRIVEKRMSQAYHRRNKRTKDGDSHDVNNERYWMKRATSFQLYNIGQVENVNSLSRGLSTHWKRCYDPQIGEIVFKKKMAYSTLEEALKAIDEWNLSHPKEKRPMQAYKCSHCKKWHIGHKSEIIELIEPQNFIA